MTMIAQDGRILPPCTPSRKLTQRRLRNSRLISISLSAVTIVTALTTDFSSAALAFTTPGFATNAIRGRAAKSDIHGHRPLNLHQHRQHPSHDYLPEPNAGPIPPDCRLTEDQIHSLLSRRKQCKRRRQYEDADKILAALNQCGIYVHDKRKEWRADGKNHFGRRTQTYVRRGGIPTRNDDADSRPLLTEEDILTVAQIVEDRYYAKRKGEFHISDELGEILKTRYKVKVDDKNREWSVDANALNVVAEDNSGSAAKKHKRKEFNSGYVPSPLAPPDHPTHTMDEELKTCIAQRLAERVDFRKKKDYRMADKIRDELIEQYSIVVDDRTREWKVLLGDSLEDDDFANEAQLSQRSAFVRKRGGNNGNGNDGDGIETEEQSRSIIPVTHQSASPTKDDVLQTALPNDQEPSSVDIEQKSMDLESLTVAELKEKLRQAGLRVSGKKADLILRLIDTR